MAGPGGLRDQRCAREWARSDPEERPELIRGPFGPRSLRSVAPLPRSFAEQLAQPPKVGQALLERVLLALVDDGAQVARPWHHVQGDLPGLWQGLRHVRILDHAVAFHLIGCAA